MLLWTSSRADVSAVVVPRHRAAWHAGGRGDAPFAAFRQRQGFLGCVSWCVLLLSL